MALMYYFGCIEQVGHYMFSAGPRRDWDFLEKNPWGYDIDSRLCPKDSGREGVALLTYKDGWTALSFWDRSIDARPNSNSNFIAHGTHSFSMMVQMALTNFPEVMARLKFQVVDGSKQLDKPTTAP